MTPTAYPYAHQAGPRTGRQGMVVPPMASRLVTRLGRPTSIENTPAFPFQHRFPTATPSFSTCESPSSLASRGNAPAPEPNPPMVTKAAGGSALVPVANAPGVFAETIPAREETPPPPPPVQAVHTQGAPVYAFNPVPALGGRSTNLPGAARPGNTGQAVFPQAPRRSEPSPADLRKPYHLQKPEHKAGKTVHSYG